MFPNFELRNVFTLALVVQWIAHQNNMSMKVHVYIILYSKTGGYRVNLLFFYFLSETKCRYSLKPPRRGGSNVCLQSKF